VMAINLVIYSVVIYRWIHRGERGKGQS